MKKKHLIPLREEALDETVGNRYHLYIKHPTKIHKFPGPMNTVIPIQVYTYELHDECTRKVYLQLKALKKLDQRRPPEPKRRYITGFGSRIRTRNPSQWEQRTSPTPS